MKLTHIAVFLHQKRIPVLIRYPRRDNLVLLSGGRMLYRKKRLASSLHTPERTKLPETRRHGVTKRVAACGYEFYLTVNFYPDTMKPGEVFIVIASTGSVVSGFVDALALTMSVALQYGVPIEVLLSKYRHMRFEPQGQPNYTSLVDAFAVAIEDAIDEIAADVI